MLCLKYRPVLCFSKCGGYMDYHSKLGLKKKEKRKKIQTSFKPGRQNMAVKSNSKTKIKKVGTRVAEEGMQL